MESGFARGRFPEEKAMTGRMSRIQVNQVPAHFISRVCSVGPPLSQKEILWGAVGACPSDLCRSLCTRATSSPKRRLIWEN